PPRARARARARRPRPRARRSPRRARRRTARGAAAPRPRPRARARRSRLARSLRGQVQLEHRARPALRLAHARAAAVASGDLAHDREPEARARRGVRVLEALEGLEDTLARFHGDAAAVVANAQDDAARAVALERDVELARARVQERVL